MPTRRDEPGQWTSRTPEPGSGPDLWNVTGGRISPEQLHIDVVTLAAQRGMSLLGGDASRFTDVCARYDTIAGPSPVLDRVDTETAQWLQHLAAEAVDWLNERAEPGRRFVLTDALYLIDVAKT